MWFCRNYLGISNQSIFFPSPVLSADIEFSGYVTGTVPSEKIHALVKCLLKPRFSIKLTCNGCSKYQKLDSSEKKNFSSFSNKDKDGFHLIQIHWCFWRSACRSGRLPVLQDLILKSWVGSSITSQKIPSQILWWHKTMSFEFNVALIKVVATQDLSKAGCFCSYLFLFPRVFVKDPLELKMGAVKCFVWHWTFAKLHLSNHGSFRSR